MFRYYIHLKNNIINSKYKVYTDDIAYDVIDAVLIFWIMARIKTITRQSVMLKLKKKKNDRQT